MLIYTFFYFTYIDIHIHIAFKTQLRRPSGELGLAAKLVMVILHLICTTIIVTSFLFCITAFSNTIYLTITITVIYIYICIYIYTYICVCVCVCVRVINDTFQRKCGPERSADEISMIATLITDLRCFQKYNDSTRSFFKLFF